jgi:hypothetical protein
MTAITRQRGDSYPMDFTVTANDVPLDITGCTFTMSANPEKEPADDSENIFALTGVILEAVDGTVRFTPTEADTDHVGKFYYDVQMVDATGAKRTVQKSTLTLKQDITKT